MGKTQPHTKNENHTGDATLTVDRLFALLHNAPTPMLLLDEEHRLFLWSKSAAELLHLPRDPVLLPAEECIEHEELRALLLGEPTHEPRELRFPDGRTFTATLTTLPNIGQLVTMQEITHIKEIERSRSEFIAAIAHDLRTPLTAAQGYIELLDRAGPLTEMQRDFVQRALLSLRHINNLIDDLLEISELEGSYAIVMHRVELGGLLLQTCNTYRPIVEEAGLILRCNVPHEPLWVMGNAARLRQAIENLISNAIKYNRPNGWVAVSAYRSDDHVIVSVADSGIGIPHEEQERIFQRFYRIHDEQRAHIPGSGLGLAIVKAVIEQHHGRIWMESTPGEGSIFSFILPLLPPESEA